MPTTGRSRLAMLSLPPGRELTPAPDAMGPVPAAGRSAAPAVPRQRRRRIAPRPLFLRDAPIRSPGCSARPSRGLDDPRDRGRTDPLARRRTDPFSPGRWLRACRWRRSPGLPPFQGGAAGLFGYDLCHHIERLAPAAPRRIRRARPGRRLLRLGRRLRPPGNGGLADLDRIARQQDASAVSRRVAEQRLRAGASLAAISRTAAWRSPCRDVDAVDPGAAYPVPGLAGVWSNFDRARLTWRRSSAAIEYIHAGDCFQVNLAQRLLARPASAAAWSCTPGCGSATPPRLPATSTWATS